MRTVLRRIVSNPEEYYCVVNHTLENFKLEIKQHWELSDNTNVFYHSMCEEQPYRIIDNNVMLPDYVSTLKLNNNDDVDMELLNASYEIEDKDNLFARLSQAFLNISPLDILQRYPGYTWVFDKTGLWLQSKTDKQVILNLFEQWRHHSDMDNMLVYEPIGNTAIFQELLASSGADLNKPINLVGVDVNRYNYSIFRTAWYDTVIYLEYIIMYLTLLNCLGDLAAIWDNTDVTPMMLKTPIQRNKQDISVEILLNKLNRRISHATNLSEVYSIIDTFDNKDIATLYRRLIAQLTFETETQIDWNKFNRVYREYLKNYTIAILSYMRWNFIRKVINIPMEYNKPFDIKTSIGKLIVKGGEPIWES